MNDTILRMNSIDIRFPGVHALDNVDFTLRRGEIHSLMGENGAGKSTLIKALTGVYTHWTGDVVLDGEPYRARNPLDARGKGVNSVYQEINLCDNISVAENIYAGREPARFGKINWKQVNSGAESALSRLNMQLDVTRLLGSYSVAVKQMIAIARAVDMNSKILILDEPTSSLDRPEVEQLFTVVRKLRDEGMSIIFISHFLDQIYELCGRVTVLRNGKLIGEWALSGLSKLDLVSHMVGKDFSALERREKSGAKRAQNEVFIEAKGLGKKRSIEPFDLSVRKGETLGLAGLLGSGRTETANLFFGIDEADSGGLRVNNVQKTFKRPGDAIKERIAFCPEDRKKNGIIYSLSVRENIMLAMQAKESVFKALPLKKQSEIADEYIKMLNIVTPDAEFPAGNLSGGNQQKVILARWLVTRPNLLILDEPTRGIDVHAKAEIMNLAMKLCEEGMSLIFISSELEEVVRCCDRIAVLRDKKKIAELNAENISEEIILETIAIGEIR